MHQVTCCSVYKLLKAAYDKYTIEEGENLTNSWVLKTGVTAGEIKTHSLNSGLLYYQWN